MTRSEAFMALFPEAPVSDDGYPNVLPCSLGGCPFPGNDEECNISKCEMIYWDKEVQI